MRRYLLKNVYIDLENMENKVKEESDWLDWTILRPGGFFEGQMTGIDLLIVVNCILIYFAIGKYRLSIDEILPQGFCQSIADVAHSCLAFSTDAFIRKTVAISY